MVRLADEFRALVAVQCGGKQFCAAPDVPGQTSRTTGAATAPSFACAAIESFFVLSFASGRASQIPGDADSQRRAADEQPGGFDTAVEISARGAAKVDHVTHRSGFGQRVDGLLDAGWRLA